MKFTRSMTMALAMMALFAVSLAVRAQDSASGPKNQISPTRNTSQTAVAAPGRRFAHRKPTGNRSVIAPVTVLNNPEYLSGEASISIAANSNPLLRIGMAQNGVTLIEFPASDKFFAIHAGNSDLVTVEKSSKHLNLVEPVKRIASRIAKTEPGSGLDKLITQLDHFKDVHRHLTGTAMH